MTICIISLNADNFQPNVSISPKNLCARLLCEVYNELRCLDWGNTQRL